jgi:hypothetical protein
LFNASDPGSELAELDWSPSRKHVSRLLCARAADDNDKQFATLPPNEQKQKLVALLTALGWPNARLDEAASTAGLDEMGGLTYAFTLSPSVAPGCSTGQFSLLQQDSVLLSLDAATAPLPSGVLTLDSAGEKALKLIDEQAVKDADAGLTVQSVLAGWTTGERKDMLPETEGQSRPVYEVRVRSKTPQCRQYRLLLNALNGDLIDMQESACFPLQVARYSE